MRVMKNHDLHLEPHVRDVRMSIARQLFAHQLNYLKSSEATASGDAVAPAAGDDQRAPAIEHVIDMPATRPRHTSRRGHYLPYGLRATG